MKKLFLGEKQNIENEFFALNRSGFLYISANPPPIPRAQKFDLTLHGFNPLHRITHKHARELADAIYSVNEGGENTLTVRNGRIALQEAFKASNRLDNLTTKSDEAKLMVSDILFNPLVRDILCSDKREQFSFAKHSKISIRLDPAEHGRKDTLILGMFFINQFQGQVIIQDFDFYGRDAHISLIDEDRLIAGVNYLDQLPEKLRDAALTIPDIQAHSALYRDAVVLAEMKGLRPDPDHTINGNPYDDFIKDAMSPLAS